MDETIQDLYVDTESLSSFNNFDVILPMPIIVRDDEKCYIRLKEFQQLNSCYNISSDLQNNTLSIKHTIRTYTRSPSGLDTPYFDDTNLFRTANPNIHKPILNSTQDALAKTETLVANGGSYSIKLYDTTITTTGIVLYENSKFQNIFDTSLSTAFMTFSNTDYLVYFNSASPTDSTFVISCEFNIQNNIITIDAPTTPVYITTKVSGSSDGVNWVELGITGTNIMTFNTNEWSSSQTKLCSFGLITSGAYQFHKVSFLSTGFSSPTSLKTSVKFRGINLVRKTAYTETIAESTTTYNKTIEDGFYSLANLNAYLNYYLIQHISSAGNLTFNNYIQGKPFLSAQNKQVLGWSSAQPYYYYTEDDKVDETYKVEVLFNPILRKMLGWISDITLFRIGDNITAPNFLNLINFKKILLSSSLQLKTKPYTFLTKTYTKATGLGDIFATINKDIPPFSYINWTNATDYKIEIDDKLITKINFKLLNEYCQVMDNIPSCNFHFQLIKEKK